MCANILWYNWRMKRIGFIGAGKAGFSLGRHVSERGGGEYEVAGYFSRDPEAVRAAASFAGGRAFENAEGLAAECDLLLLTVPDGQISDVWRQLRTANLHHSDSLLVGHCSGSQGSDVFGSIADNSVFGSIHPLVALHDRETAYKRLVGAYFTIEGGASFTSFASDLLTTLGNPFSIIAAEKKTLYHAASVMVSNLVCALTYEGMETLKACGLDEGFAENAWRSLFLGNAENIASLGPVRALTGPVERGDAGTVARHLEALTGDAREIYLRLSSALINAAQEKNPGRDYSGIRQLLQGDKHI